MAFERSAVPLLALPRAAKRALALTVDGSLCVFTVWLALSLRLESWAALSGAFAPAAIVSLLLALPLFIALGLYRAIFRYSGWQALMAVARAVMLYGVAYGMVFAVVGVDHVPRTVGLIQPMLLLIAIGASRAFVRHWIGGAYQRMLQRDELSRVLIYGAGNAGRQLAQAMAHSRELKVIGFLDDDPHLRGGVIDGLRIHDPAALKEHVRSFRISGILLALPSASRQRRNEILLLMSELHLAVRTLPALMELAHGKVQVSDLRDLDIDDLLGREAVTPNPALLGKNISGKAVLVTGAGGSIGGELCRQILRVAPTVLLLVERSEYALYSIHRNLQQQAEREAAASVPIVPLLASVDDEERMREIVRTWHPDTIYHAAAYKHVPLVEHNPVEGVRNNVFGTLVAARVAAEQRVSDFVLVSTDKAVRPANIMGTSKRVAEMALQAMAQQSLEEGGTRFSMVRFGNVLDSSGSVVPLFRQQIRDGGPITLTHPEITRYFMTMPEAAQLVVQAGAMARGGEVFVLDMGRPLRVADLARRMVELSGLTVRDAQTPYGDIEIRIVGLRPGEKLYEELLIGDNPMPTAHPRIMKAHDDFLPWAELGPRLAHLKAALAVNDAPLIRQHLQRLVLGYRPDAGVVDWVHLARQADAAEPALCLLDGKGS
jgi:FlaA1/EpsC-like NDP-sugar epimerase